MSLSRSELLTEARCVVEDLRDEHQRSGFRGDDESVWSWMVAVVEQLIELVDDDARWKAEALEVLAEWDECWDAAGRPGQLGESKAVAVRRLLEHWRDQEIVSIKPLGPRSRFTWDQQTGGTS